MVNQQGRSRGRENEPHLCSCLIECFHGALLQAQGKDGGPIIALSASVIIASTQIPWCRIPHHRRRTGSAAPDAIEIEWVEERDDPLSPSCIPYSLSLAGPICIGFPDPISPAMTLFLTVRNGDPLHPSRRRVIFFFWTESDRSVVSRRIDPGLSNWLGWMKRPG